MLERCGDWIGGLVDYPGVVTNEGAPYQPVMVIWLEAESGLLVSADLVKPMDALPRAAGLFLLAAREPKAGPPRLPRRVRVADPALGTALAGSIGDVEVMVAPTPELDEVIMSMLEHFRREPDATYLEEGLTPDEVAAFFAASAAFYRAAPWDAIPADEPLGIRCPSLGIDDGIAVVVGQLRQSFGMSLYFTRDDADVMFDAAAAADEGEQIEPSQVRRHIMVSFGDAIAPREVAEHGWQVAADDAHPRATVIEPGLTGHALTSDELAGVTAILFAIASLVTQKRQDVMHAFRGEFGIVHACAVVVCGERIAVEVTAPGEHEVVDEDPLEWESFEDHSDGELEVAITVYFMSVLGALGIEDETKEAESLGLLVDTAVEWYGKPLLRLFPIQLRHMLRQLAKSGELSVAERRLAFDMLVRAFEYAAKRDPDDPGVENCLKLLTPAAQKRFVAAAEPAKKKKAPVAKKKPTAKPKKKAPAKKKT